MSDTEASEEAVTTAPVGTVPTPAQTAVPAPAFAQQYVPANLPLPAPLEYKGDVYTNWKYFRMQWEDYETATQLNIRSQAMRMATLRSVMGKECLRIYHHLDIPDEEKKDVAKTLDALENHFTPAKNTVYERYIFNSCSQGQSETIEQYVTRLRQLASTCEYGPLTEGVIRDRLVLGVNDSTTRARMFRKPDLTLTEAINMCRIAETSQMQLQKIAVSGRDEETVQFSKQGRDKSRKGPKPAKQSSQQQKDQKCKYCGQTHERRKEKCPAYGKRCNKCSKMNHFANVCKQGHKQVHLLEDLSTSDEDTILHIDHQVGSVKSTGKQLIVSLELCKSKTTPGIPVLCQLDTGTTVNVISDKQYFDLVGSDRKLAESKSRLHLYDGSWMKPLGIGTVYAKYQDSVYKLGFQVVPTSVTRKPLLSANTCEKLGLLSINVPELINNANISTGELTEELVLKEYADVFTGTGLFRGECHIEIEENARPVQHVPRRVPVALREAVRNKLDDMEKRKVITKVTEPTNWISSMVLVKKPNKLRICIDPKDLNTVIKKPRFQMPTIEEILPRLQDAKIFSVLDAKEGFYHIKLDKESSLLTTFWTPFGRYRWLRMPFGIASAPEEYQRRQQEVLEGLDGIEVIADDILVMGRGKTQEEAVKDHDRNIRALLDRARERNLKLNRNKMKLRLTEVPYMGHLLTADGLKPDDEKIRAIRHMPKPENKTDLQRFIGFVNYLAKFAPHLSQVCEPLRRLLDKNALWTWQKEQQKAFKRAQEIVTMQPVLKYYSLTDEVTLQCDASEKGLGATLLQNNQPVAFASRALTQTEQRYAQIEKECLSIVFGCEKFRQYLLGRDCIHVQSDHKPLEVIFKKPLLSAPQRLQRMLLKLQCYDLDVQYKKGTEMYIADFLSRASLPHISAAKTDFDVFSSELENINYAEYLSISDTRLQQIQRLTASDSQLQTLRTTILTGWPNVKDNAPLNVRDFWNIREELTIQNGIIYKGHRVVVPKQMRPEILGRIHLSHLGAESCLRKARDIVYWPHMNTDIKEEVGKCAVCNEFADSQQKEPLMTHEIPSRPWSKLGIDIFTVNKKDYLVTVDYHSDYWEVDRLHTTTTAAVVKRLKVHFSRFGRPDIIVSDNGPQLVSDEFQKFASEWEFDHVTSSPFHSASNGKAESAVKIAKKLIKKTERDGTDFYKAVLDWRNTPTVGMNSSPVQRLMSRRTQTLIPTSEKLLQPQLTHDVVEKIKLKCQRAKSAYDRHARHLPELDIGQSVYVKPLPDRKEPWQKGTLTDKLSTRSYTVDVQGKTYRRNRQHLRESEVLSPSGSDIQEHSPEEDPESAIEVPPNTETTKVRKSMRSKRQTEYYQAGFN